MILFLWGNMKKYFASQPENIEDLPSKITHQKRLSTSEMYHKGKEEF